MNLPNDETLTTDGQNFESAKGRILLIACGAIAREVLAITRGNGWDHVDLTCLPAILHNEPDKITDAVRDAVTKAKSGYDTVYVLYADCGTGGQLKAACEDLGVEMLAGPHCYSFFEGNEAFATRSQEEFTTFYLTDFLVRQFESFVIKPLGLDRHPELRDMYFGHYTTLAYQAQTHDPTLLAKAKDCAELLGLAFEHHQTGYGDLRVELESWVGSPD